MQVKNFLTENCCSGSKSTSVRDIFKKWIKHKSNFFAVVDEKEHLIGVVTLYDVLQKILPFYLQMDDILADFVNDDALSDEKLRDVLDMRAEEVMTDKVVSIHPDDHFLKAATEMFSFEFDYLPVVDKQGKLFGTVSRNSLEKAILEMVNSHVS